jgi:hypothetical protein
VPRLLGADCHGASAYSCILWNASLEQSRGGDNTHFSKECSARIILRVSQTSPMTKSAPSQSTWPPSSAVCPGEGKLAKAWPNACTRVHQNQALCLCNLGWMATDLMRLKGVYNTDSANISPSATILTAFQNSTPPRVCSKAEMPRRLTGVWRVIVGGVCPGASCLS